MWRVRASTDCMNLLHLFSSTFALFPQPARLSKLVRTRFQLLWD
jgi:hypothetical protein